ncbi:MAG: hypothetical protein LBH30_04310 [Prevotellaceae bacterium]|jgi:hypothetical protein|nr:hypothetical protein [Prevotellaceae bacterium]
MKESDYIKNLIAGIKKNKTVQIGSIVEFVDDDFLQGRRKAGSTVAITGIAKSINSKTFLNVRNELYALHANSKSVKIFDFGNIAFDEEKIKKFITDISKKNINMVFLCEDDEISSTVLQIQQNKDSKTALIVADITSENKYISKTLNSKSEISVIGYQNYLSDRMLINKLHSKNYSVVRLSEYRVEPNEIEPILRESNFMAIDLSAVRYSDGGTKQSPNGLYAEELCSLANCAGLSNKISQINIVCNNDNNMLTTALAAQTVWHFVDGLSNRVVETPSKNRFRKFITDMGNSSSLTFYKSDITNRWWMEVSNGKKTKTIACTFKDYQAACNRHIPVKWIRELQKMG